MLAELDTLFRGWLRIVTIKTTRWDGTYPRIKLWTVWITFRRNTSTVTICYCKTVLHSIQGVRTSNLDDLYGLDATVVSLIDICHYLLLSQSHIQYILSSFYARDQMDLQCYR